MEELKNTPNTLKSFLKKGNKVSFHGNKAKIIEINNFGLKIKYDESGLVTDITNEEINNGELKVINKNNKNAQMIIENMKSNVDKTIKKEA